MDISSADLSAELRVEVECREGYEPVKTGANSTFAMPEFSHDAPTTSAPRAAVCLKLVACMFMALGSENQG